MKRLTTYTLILTTICFFAIFVTGTHYSEAESVQTAAYIVQADEMAVAALVVNENGGHVVSELAIIDGVAAELTADQWAAVQADARITRAMADHAVTAQGSSNPTVDYPQVIGVQQAWYEGYDGDGIGVAVVDSGVKQSGLSIAARFDAVEDGSNKPDPHGHGTYLANIIADKHTDENGSRGVAPGAHIIDVRVLNDQAQGTYIDLLEGLDWILAHKDEYNIRVANLSLSAGVGSPYWANPVNEAVEELWVNGIVVLAAAGNGGGDAMSISVPGNDPYIITVGAFSDADTPDDARDDFVTSFSGAGPTESGFVKPDILAPGAHIIARMADGTWTEANPEAHVTNHYYQGAGTSAATAVASGAVALLLQQEPDLTPNQVKYILLNSARPAVDENGAYLWPIFQQGAGRISVPEAMDLAAVYDGPGANQGMVPGTPYVGMTVYYDGYFYLTDSEGNPLPDGASYEWDGTSYEWDGTGYTWDGTGYEWDGTGYEWDGTGYEWDGTGYEWDGTGYEWDGTGYEWDGTGYEWDGTGYLWIDQGYMWNVNGYEWDGSMSLAWSPWVEDRPWQSAYSWSGYEWDGSAYQWGGTGYEWDGSVYIWDGTGYQWDGTAYSWDGTTYDWDGTGYNWDGTTFIWDGTGFTWDGTGFVDNSGLMSDVE
ncbi:MAG TPA: S8 family peptidase [Anaerolineae bacterium]|nr:S8 family peptidase [Anaerolineae bacterium]